MVALKTHKTPQHVSIHFQIILRKLVCSLLKSLIKTVRSQICGNEAAYAVVKPSVPCRRFAASKRSLNGVEVVISAKLPDNILAHASTFRRWDLSHRGGRGGTWWRKWERLNAGESNSKLTPKNFPRMQLTRAIPVA
jgi:hypothetical protein